MVSWFRDIDPSKFKVKHNVLSWEDEKMKVVAAEWFCAGHGNVGIVMVVDEYEGVKYYIGACKGLDEQEDEQWIADWGSRLPIHVGNALFGVE